MGRPEKIRLGELLVNKQCITQDQLSALLDEQRRSGRKLGRLVVELGYATDEDVARAVADQIGAPFIDLRKHEIGAGLRDLIAETQARRFRVIPLEDRGHSLLVGFVDPGNLLAYDEVVRLVRRPIDIAVVVEDALRDALDRLYQDSGKLNNLVEELTTELSAGAVDLGDFGALEGSEDAPVVKLIQTVFEAARKLRASDIHIEPQEKSVVVRFRIDGLLHKHLEADPKIAGSVVLRLKLMAGLDISEKRLPLDGRFNVRIGTQSVDMRMSTLPTQYGESVVMRVLNQALNVPSLERIGMPPHILAGFRAAIGRPNGIVLVTGPTGSGKTTTLYSALAELNTPDTKIITVEDPVEYRLPGINQVQVNDKIDLSFSRVLRASLRQDPDIMLLGEMRDRETAEIGMRAAMTGHLVLSTLHTNDAASTPIRLLDMGVPRFLVAASLHLVLAQRLVRVMCEHCRERAPLRPEEREWLRLELGAAADDLAHYRPRGCSRCHDTGFVGRRGIYEMLEMTRPLVEAAGHEEPAVFVRAAREQLAGKTLRADAARLVMEGFTTADEAMRAAYQMDD
ncbi:MAG: type II/IV secretion system protein [Betaproteobacteria bacterium]|nr:type II/IV secretion system protein [Betaproteobacteria bacterium]